MTLSFANDDNGNAPKYYVAVTLGSNAGSGFQQLVNWNPSSYTSYLNTDCQNHNWQDGNGNLLYSWFETHGATNTSTSVYEWVKLPNATITTIYLVFTSAASSDYSTSHTGVEPTYTSTYAQYDNGANIFVKYNNFASGSGWTTYGTAISTFSNGLSQTGVNSWSGITYSSGMATATDYLEAYLVSSTPAGVNTGFGTSSGVFYGTSTTGLWVLYGASAGSPVTAGTSGGTFNNGNFILTGEGAGTATAYLVANYITTEVTNTQSFANSGDIFFGTYSGTTNWQWIRERTPPPSGVMPSVTFGSVTSAYAQLLMGY